MRAFMLVALAAPLAPGTAFVLPGRAARRAARAPRAARLSRATPTGPLAFGFTDNDDFVPWKERESGFSSPLQRAAELDPAALNELFRASNAERLKQQVNPLSSFASIFRLETLVDLSSVHLQAWQKVADNLMWRQPDAEEVQRALTMVPERAIMEEFYWTLDWKSAQDAAKMFRTAFQEAHDEFVASLDGVALSARQSRSGGIISPEALDWLDTLSENDSRMALLSPLNKEQTDKTLELAGIDHHFDVRVTADSSYERDQQAYLGAAYELETAPERMVVFDIAPNAAIASHEAGMRVVCLIGAYARYELHLADMTISAFDDLNSMSFGRLFSDAEFDTEPALQLEPEVAPRQVKVAVKTRVATRTKTEKAQLDVKAKTKASARPTVKVPDHPPRVTDFEVPNFAPNPADLGDDGRPNVRRQTYEKV